MASEIGRGAQVRLDDTARALARGGNTARLIDNIRAKAAGEAAGTLPSGNTPDGSLGNGTAADDEMLVPGGEAGTFSYTASGTGAVTRGVSGKIADALHIADFGAVADGVTDNTTAINNAIASATTQKKRLVFGGGIYVTTGGHMLTNGLEIEGQGRALTTIKLKAASNRDIFGTPQFYTYYVTQPNNTLDVDGWRMSGLTLDGNRWNQAPADADRCNGLAVYSSNFVLQDVQIQNVRGHGIRSAGAPNYSFPDGPEASVINCRIYNTGRHGWWFSGPTDSSVSTLMVANVSQEADATWCGVYSEMQGNARWFNFHGYSFAYALNEAGSFVAVTARAKYQLSSGGNSQFTCCHFEGGRGQYEKRGSGPDLFVGCQFYAQFGAAGTAMCDLHGTVAQFAGCNWEDNTAATIGGHYAIKFGKAGTPCSGTTVTGCYFGSFATYTPFNFENDGGTNRITECTGFCASGGATTFGGTKAANTYVSYAQTGTVLNSRPPPVGHIADSTATGGNARGAGSADWQTVRFAATQVASGLNAVIAGGSSNTASANNAVVSGGVINTASGTNSWVPGGLQGSTRGVAGRGAWSSGLFLNQGDAQAGEFVLRQQSTGASAVTLTADAAAAGAGNTVNVPVLGTYLVRLLVLARQTGGASGTIGDSAGWVVDALVKRAITASSATLIGGGGASLAPSYSDAAAAAWRLAVTADTTNGGLAISGTGEAGKTINWVARVLSVEAVG
jgi:hypothetical protein